MKKIILGLLFMLNVFSAYSQLSWLQMAPYPGAGKAGMSAFSVNNKGYMGLGYDISGAGHNEWYEYNPANNSWTQKAGLPATGRWTCASFVINGKIYIVTGATNSGPSNAVFEYDPATDTWTPKANYPGGGRENANGFSIGTKGYVGTGYAGGSSYPDFYEYDQPTDTWTAKADFPGIVRNGCAAFSLGNLGYFGMGNGNNASAYFNDFYQYDPSANQWTQKANFTLPYVNGMTVYANNGNGYILCGYYYQPSGITHNPLNMLYKYEQASDTWTLEGTFPGYPRGYAAGFTLNNDIYIGGGAQTNDGTGILAADFWKLSNGLTLMVENNHSDVDVELFPNPVNSILNIPSVENDLITKIRIYDIKGALVQEKDIATNQLDVSKLTSGLYFIEFITLTQNVLDGRFIKE